MSRRRLNTGPGWRRTLAFYLLVVAASLIVLWPVAERDTRYRSARRALDEEDYAAAAERLAPLADGGDLSAQFSLGVMHERGLGVPRRAATAVDWYRRAAESGLPQAQVNLGLMLLRGDGIPADPVEAFDWFRRAAEQGFPAGQANLGRAYLEGSGTPKDAEQAERWLRSAAEQGHALARLNLAMLLAGTGSEGFVESLAWARLAAAGQGPQRAAAARLVERLAAGATLAQRQKANELATEIDSRSRRARADAQPSM